MEPNRVTFKGYRVTLNRKAIMEFIDSLIQKVSGKKVLDVGAGTWEYPRKQFKPVCKYITSDVFQDPLIDIVSGVENLKELYSEEFDVLTCFDVLEHVKNPFKATQSLFSILKPGGFLALTVPFNFWIHANGEKGFYDYWRFTEHGLRLLLEDFSKIDIQPLGDKKAPLCYKVIAEK